ncbi:MAG TPA: hypothetical protein VM101_01475 [Flavitalea sp.]|nr:hypothetical protein [Flavitalea sp.]
MPNENSEVYSVPAKFRSLENLHVLFWLVKDICWCIGFKPLGIAMIFPTLSVAIYIMIKNRHMVSELTHNLAIMLWIAANSMWMVFEFTGTDEQLKNYCLIPFLSGLAILVFYYGYYVPAKKRGIDLVREKCIRKREP